jgi:hypothetical protein
MSTLRAKQRNLRGQPEHIALENVRNIVVALIDRTRPTYLSDPLSHFHFKRYALAKEG